MSEDVLKDEIEDKLYNALKRLIDRALYDGAGTSFFVPKSVTDPGFDAV
jgi:hypothetical protein